MPHFIYRNIVCTTIILYSRPNWYALVKRCINVNHYVLLVRRHLKYVWFTKFMKFWVEVKNDPFLGVSKNKKAFCFRGLCPWPLTRGSAPGLCWELCPRPPSVPPAPNLPLHHCLMCEAACCWFLIPLSIANQWKSQHKKTERKQLIHCNNAPYIIL